MGIYNFQPRFVPFILDGRKTHTIRAPRRSRRGRPGLIDLVGGTMHLYTGLRRKGARLLLRALCVKVEEIRMAPGPRGCYADVYINGVALDDSEKELLARRDGFNSFLDMIGFWAGRLPFDGHIYHWKPQAQTADRREKSPADPEEKRS